MHGCLRWVLILAVVSLAGCKKKPKAGDLCPGQDFVSALGVCAEDGKTYLACEMDGFHPYECKGKRGCYGATKGKLHEVCDFSGAKEGDPCPSLDARPTPALCTPDGKSMIVCDRMTWPTSPHTAYRKRACGGPKGCSPTGPGLACDETAAKVGDPCDVASDANYVHPLYTCLDDGKAMLRCARVGDEFRWEAARSCRGAKGCKATPENRNVECDATVAEEGDPCQDGNIACSMDGASRLGCKAGKFVKEMTCKPACTTTWTTAGTWDVTCPQ
jgi:hypothetical protein